MWPTANRPEDGRPEMAKHHHYYDSEQNAWMCRECGCNSDYCEQN
jgi:hypothetical protein